MNKVLVTIVIAQFLCTSLWFAGNAIIPDIISNLHLSQSFLAQLTSAIQLGFIAGTLLFAVLYISDRFSPSLIFLVCAILAAACNLVLIVNNINTTWLLFFRFTTGFFLAGIYPVGMKIAADYYQKELSKSLGFLVGALVLGTAFPHLLKSITAKFPFNYVIYTTSLLSLLGGHILFLVVPDGPYRKLGQQIRFTAFLEGFKNKQFRLVALGYFGHMWELYAFWTFVPVMLTTYKKHFPNTVLNVPLLSFFIIAIGSLACVCSGLLSQKLKSEKIATVALLLSCLCCLFSPLFLLNNSIAALLIFLFFWAFVVIADSPLFSTLVAQSAPEASKGTSLTIVNYIGFSITIISVQFISALSNKIDVKDIYMFLAIGPILGLVAMLRRGNYTI